MKELTLEEALLKRRNKLITKLNLDTAILMTHSQYLGLKNEIERFNLENATYFTEVSFEESKTEGEYGKEVSSFSINMNSVREILDHEQAILILREQEREFKIHTAA